MDDGDGMASLAKVAVSGSGIAKAGGRKGVRERERADDGNMSRNGLGSETEEGGESEREGKDCEGE